MDKPSVLEFMARVVSWPAPGDKGVVNLHWFRVLQDGKRIFSGRPFSNPAALLEFADWCNRHVDRGYRDLYFCLSQQSMFNESRDGKRLIAVRSKNCVVSLKSVWLDIDVKEGAYSSTEEAMAALTAFCEHYKMRGPSAIVRSGSGGMHCYWFNDEPMTVETWRHHATRLCAAAKTFGLKFDPQCTIDPVRVLRVPGTKNFKTNDPKGVSLSYLEDTPDGFS